MLLGLMGIICLFLALTQCSCTYYFTVNEMDGKQGENRRCTSNERGTFQTAIKNHEKHLKVAKETGDRAGEGEAYGYLGIAYQSLGDSQKAIECHEKHLKIAKETGDRIGEGRAYDNIGRGLFSLEQFKNAADNFRCALEAFNTVRSFLKSEDDWKMNFRELYEATYTGLWKTLIRMEKLDEAFLAAEQGRAQTLTDNLLIQYKLPASSSAAIIDLKEIIFRFFTELSSPILFLAVDGLTINIWLLSRGKKVIFRQGRLEGDRRETDPVRALLQNCLEKIRTEVGVGCEDRTLDELPLDCQSSSCLLYTSPSPRDLSTSRMPSSA